jgi:propanol-preferring alcohol dehydrogenase
MHAFSMRALEISQPHQPLRMVIRPRPRPGPGCVLIRVTACGVCRTDLHIADGDLPLPGHPVVPGHEIIGVVAELGSGVNGIHLGERIGVPWLGWSCGICDYCRSSRENLCDDARFTGYHIDGGYADYALADARYCFAIPPQYGDAEAAPLLCAGLIGYRAYAAAGNAMHIGIYGFGAAAHILTQIAVAEGRRIYAYTRPDDVRAQSFARRLGAVWAGASDESAPQTLDAAIIFASAGSLVLRALSATRKGGRVVCAGIHMSDIPSFPYRMLWGERQIVSVANLTRRDGEVFFDLAGRLPIHTTIRQYALVDGNLALADLRCGQLSGAAVLVP